MPKKPVSAEVSRGRSTQRWGRPEFVNGKQDSKMRKRNKKQRNYPHSGQGNLFEGVPTAPTGMVGGGTAEKKARLAELLSRLTGQLASTRNLLDEIMSEENLGEAFGQVKANDGSMGVDGMDIEATGRWVREHLDGFRRSVLLGDYEVNAVRKVEIPKPNGGVRTLGIPTVKDRVLQQAILQVLNRYYEPYFSEHSYGFRPGRGAQDALRQSSRYVMEGYEWVVDIDLEKFFDKINHDRLMSRLKKGIGDKRLLRLINNYLKAGLMSDGMMEQRIAGTPQGGPLSPLLSNIVLDELDRELESRGHKFCRYADDCNIYVRSEEEGQLVMVKVIKFIEGKLKLRVNREKSGVRHCTKVKFLGFTLLADGGVRVADKPMETLKDKIRKLTSRSRGVKFEQVVHEVNATVTGWAAYFRKANKWLGDLHHTDGWIRRRLRCYRLKQTQRKYGTYKFLRGLGASKGEAWNVVMHSQGWWAMSQKKNVHKTMSVEWFTQQGLRSIHSEMTRRKH